MILFRAPQFIVWSFRDGCADGTLLAYSLFDCFSDPVVTWLCDVIAASHLLDVNVILIFSITLRELKLQGIKIRDVSPVILVFLYNRPSVCIAQCRLTLIPICLVWVGGDPKIGLRVSLSSVVERRTCNQKVGGMNPSVGNHSTHVYNLFIIL